MAKLEASELMSGTISSKEGIVEATRKTAKTGMLIASRTYSVSGTVRSSTDEDEQIEVPQLDPNLAQARVEYQSSTTVNIGNFESIKVGVSVSLPSYITELHECYEAAKQFVEAKIQQHMVEIRELKESRKREKGKV